MEDVKDTKIKLFALNKQQEKAVLSPLGPTLVAAGAGSGKTTVLVKRFEYLVKLKGINPERILFLTFTNKNVASIKDKLKKIFDDASFLNRLNVTTFHSFGIGLLKNVYGAYFFKVCNEERSKDIVRQIAYKHNLSLVGFSEVTQIILDIKRLKLCTSSFNQREFLKGVRKDPRLFHLRDDEILNRFKDIRLIMEEYQSYLNQHNLVDFPDMLTKAEAALLENEDFRRERDDYFEAILFDEFQDVDEITFSILKLLTRDKNNIFCVGDLDQSIYGFRDVVANPFEKFKEHYKDINIFKLETNYRSTPQILDVANQLLSKNYEESSEFHRSLTPVRKDGDKVVYFTTDNAQKEVNFVVNEIMRIQNDGVELSKIGVFNRSKNFSDDLITLFMKKKIPYIKADSFGGGNSTVIKDLRT